MKNKICVYTCITGDYDNIKELKEKEKGIDYYLFTNNKKIKSNTWNVVYIEDKELSNVLLARKTKILGNDIVNKYDIALWMDAAVEFNKDINDFINNYMNSEYELSCFRHGIRNSILEEMNACLRFRKEDISNIDKLKDFYEKEKYNYDNGLIESTVYIKKPKNNNVCETMKIWFEIVKKYTKRDQLSFNYAISKTNIKINWIEEKVFDNPWFKWHEHNGNILPKDYMIYYGNIDDYDYFKQYSSNYNTINDEYIIDTKVLNDCNEIYVELSNSKMIKYSVNSINIKCNIIQHNTINYLNNFYFYKNPGFIILNGKFKKNSKIEIKLFFNTVEENEKNEIIEQLINEREEIKKEMINVGEAYELVLNSLSWKVTKPIRFVSEKIRKK